MAKRPNGHVTLAGLAVCAAAAAAAFGAGPAAAHEGEKSTKAAVLVRQAIALIVNTPNNTMAIEDKINDATNSDDKTGVAIDLVRQAKDALGRGNLHRVRALLEVSIGARPHKTSALPLEIRDTPAAPGADAASYQLASGDSPGPGIADDPLDARRHLDGRTTTMLVVSLLLIAVGAALAVRYRPIPTGRLRAKEAS